MEIVFNNCAGFDWDEGNQLKNWEKHKATAGECEQVFLNHPRIALPDPAHSTGEARFYALGQSDAGRLLFLAFAVRGSLIRVISARDMSRKERKAYQAP